MNVLVAANLVAVVVAAWAVWECRLTTFRSRWDSPKKTALLLFALAAVLDSPFRAVSAASFDWTGRYYFFMVVGHVCYLTAAASGVKYVYLRLLPDAAIGSFVRKRMVPLVTVAAIVMVVSFFASPQTSTLRADHLYLLRPDRWLTVYWLTFYTALSALLLAAMYGINRLRADPRSVMLSLLMTSLVLGEVSVIVSAVGLFSGHNATARLVAWPITYAAIAIGSVAVVIAWRRRVWSMLGPAQKSSQPDSSPDS